MTRIEEIELKPCPFCGGKAVIETMTVRKGYEAVVKCNGYCLASVCTITYDTEQDAISAATGEWNNRAESEEEKRLSSELEQKDALLKEVKEICNEQIKDHEEQLGGYDFTAGRWKACYTILKVLKDGE